MPRFTYHKHRPNLWEDLDLNELVNAMSDFLLGSGFGEPADGDNRASQEDLKNAIVNALMTSELLPDEDLQKLFSSEETLNEFLEKVIERLMNEGFIRKIYEHVERDPFTLNEDDDARIKAEAALANSLKRKQDLF